MNRKLLRLLLPASIILLTASAPFAATLETLTVDNDRNSGNLHSIQTAIDQADRLIKAEPTRRFRIFVKADPNPYTGPIRPISNVDIIGESTSGTFIAGSGTLIELSKVSNVTIRSFTFKDATNGISVTDSSSITLRNNVFQQLTGSAVQVQNSASQTSIINNTFYNNAIAISTSSDIGINNNIFAYNRTTAISALTTLNNVSYNDYFPPTEVRGVTLDSHSLPNPLTSDADPRFVDAGSGDFHLGSDSPCIDAGDPSDLDSFDGSTSDMGAYGGPYSDLISTNPSAVTGLISSIASPPTAPAVMTLSWNRSSNSAVTGYRVYYGTSSRNYDGTGADEGPSGFSVGTNSATLTFKELPATPAAPETAPTLAPPVAGNQTLQLSWTQVANATGYRIYYSTSAFDSSNLPANPSPIDVNGGGTTSYTLTGLQNGTTYFVRVSALAGNRIFAAVTAVVDSSVSSAPGSPNESPYSQETSQSIGPTVEGPLSDQQSDFPEAVSPFPNLKGGGCFIATAAYGFYSSPQVQALRIFRDRYLMTNSPGRAFVAWYYRVGPRGADLLRAHPWLKLPVRVALFPLVVIAWFLAYTSPVVKAVMLLGGISSWALFRLRFRCAVASVNGGRR